MLTGSRIHFLVLCMVTLFVVVGCGKKETTKGKVFFVEPKDGAEIQGPVKVVMGVEGMKIQPAGEVVEGTGHHHILINQDFFPPVRSFQPTIRIDTTEKDKRKTFSPCLQVIINLRFSSRTASIAPTVKTYPRQSILKSRQSRSPYNTYQAFAERAVRRPADGFGADRSESKRPEDSQSS